MRIVITGATGNVGTAVVEALAADDAVDAVVGLARRRPAAATTDRGRSAMSDASKVSWQVADVASDDLTVFAGADAVIHLAWRIQPIRDEARLWSVNVNGTRRVVDAAARHGVRRLVVASSVGAYAPGPDEPPVDESWPATGVASSIYSRQKAVVETLLDAAEAQHPGLSIVRMRTSLVFSARAASEVARYFLGPLVPWSLAGRGALPVFPFPGDLRFQAVHARDAADAYRRAALGDSRGAFNVAAGSTLGAADVAAALGARHVDVPVSVLRGAVTASYALRLQRTSPGWIDLATSVPTMDTSRATDELGWRPLVDSRQALADLIEGFARRSGTDTPPLRPGRNGALTALFGSEPTPTGSPATVEETRP